MTRVRLHWYKGYRNVGDILVVPILRHFHYRPRFVEKDASPKLVGIGSVMQWVRPGDTVWGTGCISPREVEREDVKFLAVRGPLTRAQIIGSPVPEIYGDPAVLLPLVFNPTVAVTHEVGYIPHYVDKKLVDATNGKLIDVEGDWQDIVRQIKSCRKIVSSSLHGIILAEAYGVPVEWAKYSDNIIGGEFKFQDYFLGTGRERQVVGPIVPPANMPEIQQRLIAALAKVKQSDCVVGQPR